MKDREGNIVPRYGQTMRALVKIFDAFLQELNAYNEENKQAIECVKAYFEWDGLDWQDEQQQPSVQCFLRNGCDGETFHMSFSAEASLYNMKEQLDWIVRLDLISRGDREGRSLMILKEPLPLDETERESKLAAMICSDFWVPEGYEIVRKVQKL